MAKNKFGFAGLNQGLNSNNSNSNLSTQLEELNLRMISARVTDIILSDTHPQFFKYGEWTGLGTIFCEPVNSSESSQSEKLVAKPLIPYIKNYPLVNEIVLLFALPNPSAVEEATEFKPYYYLNPISLWNHPHHNAYPNVINNNQYEKDSLDYKAIEEGKTKNSKNNPQEISLTGDNPSGGNFVEKGNIHPIMPFIGDNIFEGRFGNRIRLGSTVRSKSIYQNNWSQDGEEGDPISIFSNGQPLDVNDEGWVPIVEDINKDLSSIYLTSTQKIPIQASSRNYTGIRNQFQPTYPASYDGPQVILNSGRLLFNTTTDSILLSSKKIITLSAVEDIGISSRGNVNLTGNEIRLGSANGGEAVILGDSFIRQFNNLLDGLEQLTEALTTEPLLKTTPLVATGLQTIITTIRNQSNGFLSKITKTL